MWMQVSHPGRQVNANMPGVGWGPSDVAVDVGKHSKRFGRPSAMTPQQISATIQRFVTTAARAEEAIQQAAHTGSIGDGKIFVFEMASAVRIRTGETNETAL